MCAASVALAACGGDGADPPLPLRSVADVPLPDGSSRFDYQSLDTRRNRLFVAHLGAGNVVVVDVRCRRGPPSCRTSRAPTACSRVPALGRVYASATGTHELVTIDERTNRVVARTPAGDYPDGVAYDPVDRRVFVSDESGGIETVVDARTGRRVGSVSLGGEAGNVQFDPVARRVLVAVQGRDELAVIDARRERVTGRYPLKDCESGHGLHLDPPRRLAFVACEGNAALLVFDLRARRVVARFSTGEGPDVLDFDPGLRRLYVAAESGEVAIFQERGRSLRKVARGRLAADAHSVAVDPRTHLLYFPLEDMDGRPVLRIMRPSG